MNRSSGAAWQWSTASAVCGALGIFALSYPLNHDVGWYLHIARAVLDGQTLYTSVIEVNPPLYAYLSKLPVELGATSGVSAVRLMQFSILVVSLLAVLWTGKLAMTRGLEARWFGPLVAVAFAIPVLGLAGVDFGQREHILVVLASPYLVLAARRVGGDDVERAPAVAAGLLAGAGFSLKPHFVILWLVFELLLVASRRIRPRGLLRAETLAASAFMVAYGAFVLVVHPEYIELLRQAGPLYADYLSVDRTGLFTNRYSIFLGTTAAAYFFVPPSRAVRPLVSVLLIVAGLAFLVAVGQGKGWLYHFFPSLAWTTAAAVLMVTDYAVRLFDESGRLVARSVGAVVAVLAVGILAAGSLVVGHRGLAEGRRSYVAQQSEYFSEKGIRSIVILSPSLPAAFPLVNYAEVEWNAPFPSLWWVDAAHANDPPVDTAGGESVAPPAPHDSTEAAFLESMATGVARRPPDAILVDTTRIERLGGRPFPYAAYLAQNPEFDAMWQGYESRGTVGPFEVYSRAAAGEDPTRR